MIELWNTILLEPIINGLMILSNAFWGNFGLAIIFLTIIVNFIILPLTLKQTRSTVAMQQLQPKMQELQKKYGKDKQKLQQETMKLYKEAGMSPMGCFFPMLIQFPIWIALYQAVIQALAKTPEALLGLSQRLYPWPFIQEAIPPENHFLWMDLAAPNFLLAILVMATMWVSQKMTMPGASGTGDPKQQQMQGMMQWLMPIMIGFIFIYLPSGLALYIVVMNIFRMIVQYFVMGNWGGLASFLPSRATAGSTDPGTGELDGEKQDSKVIEGSSRETKSNKKKK
ncbi:MAG: YidC/Oxa1 family membrane protein insertase [Dehalococcoidia bacterium]